MDFLLRKGTVKSAQKVIDKLEPKVNVHIPPDLPLPSIGVIKKHAATASKVNGLEEKYEQYSDQQLRGETDRFRQAYQAAVKAEKEEFLKLEHDYNDVAHQDDKEEVGLKLEKAKEVYHKAKQKFLDEILPEAFAVTREAGKRVLHMRHYDIQLVGGMVLHGGNIAEMTTGEGKTLVATLPAYLNAVTGDGVHVITVNDYLAKRDAEWMGPLYEFLGLSVGVIQHDMDSQQRQHNYACDITYGTNNEFGFDYLRDNMVIRKEEMVQRPHHFAIVDEVDSILIDEARTPLIISGPTEESTDKYYTAHQVAKQLKGRRTTEKDEIDAKHQQIDLSEGYDYLADEKNRSISLTESGEEKGARMFGVENLHDMETMEARHHILAALKAKEFFVIDVDYVVKDGQVIIVDEFTGRLMPGRRWSDGLHQAVEAKEGIKIQRENQTLATITFQNYFRMYDKLSGMTGTAETEATEFSQIYKLDCVVMPTNKVLQRKNYADAIYRSVREKYQAVVDEIAEFYDRGQPVLVGTISIEKSELLSKLLTQRGIKHQVLNAKFHEMEANIIAQAGRFKAVTIATNMAGRGTDIVLGGNAEFLAKNLAEQKSKDDDDEETKKDLTKKFLDQFKAQTKEEHRKVLEQGGLHVIGTERHESRRIDNQLRGRQGRQGDPGSSKFFVSLEDDLMRLFASDRIIGMMDKLGMEEGQVLDHPWLSKAIENAQRRVETHNFEIRKHLLEYDDVMNRQREVIYSMRRSVIESENIKSLIVQSIDDLAYGLVGQYLRPNDEGDVDLDGLALFLKTKYHLDIDGFKDALLDVSTDEATDKIRDHLVEIYDAKESQFEPGHLRHIERMVMLNTIDAKWKDHLYGMDQLKEGIGLRSLGQRDPLIEYKKEGFAMFETMYDTVNQEAAEVLFKIQAVNTTGRMRGVFGAVPKKMVHNEMSSLAGSGPQPAVAPPGMGTPQVQSSSQSVRKSTEKVGRNDPCPCGSGKKFKKCCGR
ncbi:MAG: preprotein translocase subunit SecA [Candidatus Omnitrophica bacterium]|nr:preprotein translocase subunit SecA [Candidatus Omnitrophota bacterium]